MRVAYLLDNLLQINVPINASIKLSGALNHKMSRGNISIFQITIHIITNTVNQAKKVVYNRLNFVERINITIANKNPQIIQTIPFTGSFGKTRFKFW